MATQKLDLENERKYLISLIKNAAEDPGNAQWAAEQAQRYAEQYPGFSLDKPYVESSTNPSTAPDPISSITPAYTDYEGKNWYKVGDYTFDELSFKLLQEGKLGIGPDGIPTYATSGSYLGGYQSPYSSKIDALLAKLNSISPFNPESIYTSPEYLALKERLESESKKTSQDVLGAASALTGGIPSSYAVAAAKESESDVKNRLNEMLPSLLQAAYNRYLQEHGLTMDQINLLAGLEDSAYQRYATDRSFNQSVLESLRNYERGVFESDRAFNYQVSRDKLLDQRWLDQFDYQKKQDALNYGLRMKQISIDERNAALARDKFEWEKDPTNPANMKDPETIGALYSSMMNSDNPEKWLKENAQWLTKEELKTLAGFLPKNEAVQILERILSQAAY